MSLPKTFAAGERLFASDLNNNFEYLSGGTPTDGQVLTFNSTSGKWEAKDLKMKEKRIARFTGNGTWTVPAGVTYAIAHMRGGGGGNGTGTTGGDGGTSSVAFAAGTVSALGAPKTLGGNTQDANRPSVAGPANSGMSAQSSHADSGSISTGQGSKSSWVVAGAEVTPAASIAVTVGAGGAAGTGATAVAGGSGYVYIEYYEEV